MPPGQMGLPPDTLWHISQQQCEPPQLCHQTSSKTLRRATGILVPHADQVMQTTGPRAGQPSVAHLPDLSAEPYQNKSPKHSQIRWSTRILQKAIHTATTKWHLQHKGSDYQKFLCEVGNDCQKHLRSTAIDLIDNFMAITVKATFKAFPLQHHWCQKALHIRLQLVYTFLYNRDSQLVGCCWYLLQ